MHKVSIWWGCFLLFLFGVGVVSTAQAEEVPNAKLNKKIEGVTFTDLRGKSVSLESFAGKKATVVVFLWFDCPVSNSYAAPLTAMAEAYAEQGVRFIGIVPTDDPLATIAKQVREFKIGFPVFADPKLEAATIFKAETVPQAFLLDHNSMLRYRGRIDDGYYARLKRNATISSHDLRDAIEATVAGKDVPKPVTNAVGCPIGTRTPKATVKNSTITYHKQISRILQTHCQGCHRPGQVGPFPLMTYRHAMSWADDIVTYTESKKMPPWKPDAGVPFSNARQMPEADIRTLAEWVEAGCPEGDPKDAPPPATYTDGWQLGKPDLILEVPEEFHVGAAGKDVFRCFVLPTGLKEDQHVVAFEVKPGNPRVVHHTLNFWDTTGTARKMADEEAKRAGAAEKPDHGPGYSVAMGLGFLPKPNPDRPGVPPIGGMGGWAPGQMATKLPDGVGFYLPSHADMVIQTHYHRTGKPETDRLKIGLYFAKSPIKKRWQVLTIQGLDIFNTIPAGEKNHKAGGSTWLLTDANLHSVMPHMHLLGKSVKVTMTPPDGKPVVLVNVPEWDYSWQETFWLKEPIHAQAGTRFDIEAIYDNSESNPNNPNSPPRRVFVGEQTTNEMLFGFLGVTATESTPKNRVRFTRLDPALSKKLQQKKESEQKDKPK